MDDPRFDVTVLHGALQRFPTGWRWSSIEPRLDWPGYILWTVLAGGARMRVAGRAYELTAGDVVLMDMTAADNDFVVTDEHPLGLMQWVHFVYNRPVPEVPAVCRRIGSLGFWDALVHRAIQAHYARTARPGFDNRWMAAALQEMYLQDIRQPGGRADRQWPARIDRLCREVRMNPGRTWSLRVLAERVGLSERQFGRVFRRCRECTPAAFVITARTDAARELLRMSNKSVAEIAEMLGYCDAFAFSKQFRRQTGQSPSAYRAERR